MLNLKENRSGIRQIALFGLSLFCLCADVEGMIGSRMSARRQTGVGAQVSGEFVRALHGYCMEARKDVGDLRNDNRLGLFSRARDGEPVNQSNFGGIVAREGRKLIVAFPGTRTDQFAETLVADVKADLGVYPLWFGDGGFADAVGEPEILVHAGFARVVEGYWDDMVARIEEAGEFDEIYFTGHSKGGGVALLSALKYAQKQRIPRSTHKVKVFTFAAPAVFRGDPGVELFYRHIDGLDAVCLYKNTDMVPYSTQPFDCRHVGIQGNIDLLKEDVKKIGGGLFSIVKAGYHVYKKEWLKAVSELPNTFQPVFIENHYLEQFTGEQIDAEMEVINYNYQHHPEMSINFMGKKKYEER